jgi:hypothetical protein
LGSAAGFKKVDFFRLRDIIRNLRSYTLQGLLTRKNIGGK